MGLGPKVTRARRYGTAPCRRRKKPTPGIPSDNSAADLHANGREVTAMDYWELFCDTGAPEAYLLWRGQQEAVCKTEKQ